MLTATLLLPDSGRLEGLALPPALGRALARGVIEHKRGGEAAQLRRHLSVLPDSEPLPVAALTRQVDAGDAGREQWLRADPCFVAADMQGVRLLAHGPALALTAEEAAAFADELIPVFAERGLQFSAPDPSRWYLRLSGDTELPALVPVDTVLGDDLFDHLPSGPSGRLWRSLLSDTQMLLHQLPINAKRQAAGKAMVNSLWFWGAGTLPDQVRCIYGQIRSPDPLLQAVGQLSGRSDAQQQLVDLRHVRDGQTLIDQALMPLVKALADGELSCLQLDLADGLCISMRRSQRWHFWRRALTRFPK